MRTTWSGGSLLLTLLGCIRPNNARSALVCVAPAQPDLLVVGSCPIEQRGSDFLVKRRVMICARSVVDCRERGSAITSPRPAPADVALGTVAATVLGVAVGVLLAGVAVGAGTAVVFRFVLRTIISRK